MKSMMAHGVLAAAGLLFAWSVWTEGDVPEGSEDMVELFACSTLDSIEYRGQRRRLTLERKEQSGDVFHWLTAQDVPENQVTESTEGAEPRFYLVAEGEETEAWLDRYAPFKALRSLGEVEDELLEDLELSDESDTIVVKCGDQTGTYEIGGATFGAQGSRYVRAEGGGPVFLVEADLINRMRGAESELVQRDLHGFEATEIAKLEVEGQDATITLLQRDRTDEQAAVWVDAANPERRNDLYGNWMSRVRALTASSYLALDAEPGSDLEDASSSEVTEILSLRYLDEGDDELGRLQLVRVGETDATYYGKTETTRAWVRLPGSVGRQVESDGRQVLGLEPLPASTTAAPDAPQSVAPELPPSHPPIPTSPHGAAPHGGSASPATMTAPTMSPAPAMRATPTMSASTMGAPATGMSPTATAPTMGAPTKRPSTPGSPTMAPPPSGSPTMAP